MSAGGRPPSIRTGRGRSLAQSSIAKQIAEASKSPKLGRSGDRHSRCPQRRAAPLALSAESANLCELRLASACDCCEPSWLGRAWATTARSTTDNTSTPTLRSEQTAVDRSGRCDDSVGVCRQHAPAPRDPSSPYASLLSHSGLAGQLPGDLVVHQGQLSMVARPPVTQPAGSSFFVGEGTRPRTMQAEFSCAFCEFAQRFSLGICAFIGPCVRIRRFLIGS